MSLSQYDWLNEPFDWQAGSDWLNVTTDHKTDFWQQTWYGFQRHSGHVFGRYVEDNFTFQLCIEGCFEHLYDQAGIMLLVDEKHWLKGGVEYSDGQATIGSVFTRHHSDWSMGIFPGNPSKFWLRLTCEEGYLRLQYSIDGLRWPLLRLSPFLEDKQRVFVGAMCCSPERQGLQVKFSDFRLTPPIKKPLHDLS
ncbi:DUF1349 domain-containing protein [Photorhabdus tasmaniensis]|uniref:DUF1349 domain-containing protein n=1 Tax=Photorhabdus tasmaniensis TaxID=1004159 RepID=A0ABX0GKN8_9GAMM|nr:DUF1349 domain-containing protein [Photorhabdus tasmaniensis]NHB89785.1 DUF1349 domain-containing protein [Photorhabdus tasmaniensis]